MPSAKPITINFITGNKNKLAEVTAILGDFVQLHHQTVEIPEIQGSLEEIARDKCRKAAIAVCRLTFSSTRTKSLTNEMILCILSCR
jgi:inosine triphosphate pyrophosphatase